MTMTNMFICPECGHHEIKLHESNLLMSDVRSDIIECSICGAVWRGFSRVVECQIELLRNGMQQASDSSFAGEATSEDLSEVDSAPHVE